MLKEAGRKLSQGLSPGFDPRMVESPLAGKKQ